MIEGAEGEKIPEKDYQFKRLLLKEELEEVNQLIRDAHEFTEHYPNHKKWLDNALKEVNEGIRLAYGILKPITIDGQPELKIIGVGIVKITEPFAELKSLFLKKESRHKEQNYGSLLYENIEKKLLKRGLTKIITDVPYKNKSTSWFLIKQGFQINGLIERYKKGDLNYILSKDVTPYYIGDPFDWCSLVTWFLENIYRFDIYKSEEIDEKTLLLSFNLNTNKNNSVSSLEAIKGISLVYDGTIDNNNIETICSFLQEKDATICSVVAKTFKEDNRTKFIKKRILPLDQNQVYDLSGYNKPSFEKDRIIGIIVEIRHIYFERIKDDEDFFVYFKGPGIGKYSKEGDKILFFVDSCNEHPYGAIMGFGKIKECSSGIPEKQWNRYKNMNPKFSKDEFYRFAGYKNAIIAFVVEDFKRISPIGYRDIITILRKKIMIEEVGHQYLDEDLINLFSLLFSEEKEKKDLNLNNLRGEIDVIAENVRHEHKDILTKLDTIATSQDEIRELNLKIQDEIIEISSPGIKETLKIKLSTPGSGILPISLEKETNIDLCKISYDGLKKDLEEKFGRLGCTIFERLKSKNWIKK